MPEWVVFPLLGLLGLGCLIGFGLFLRSQKPSSGSSVVSSEALEALREEFRSFKRSMEGEWEDTYQKMRSIAGRIDRAKRSMKESEEKPAPHDPLEGASGAGGPPLDEAAINREILRSRGIPL